MVRFDILKYLRVIWDPMGVFVAKQGVIMSHWGSMGDHRSPVGLSGGQRGSWVSVGLSGGQCAMYIHPFSKYQCGLREGVSTQYCLIYMIQKWKTSLDNSKTFTALLPNLHKAFDCLPLKLIIGKLNPYSFSLSPSELIHSCSPNQ